MSRTTGYRKTGRDYAQFDVLAAEHPKVAALTDPQFRVWFEAICYCHRNLSDGFIPAAVVKQRWAKHRKAFVEGRLWDEVDGGVRVHDYLDWNDSRVTVETRIANAQRAGQLSAQARFNQSLNGRSNGSLNGELNPALLSSGSSNPRGAKAPKCEECGIPVPHHSEDCSYALPQTQSESEKSA